MGIVTDLDDTLVGSSECLSAFLRWREGRPQWGLVYATGRYLDSALELIREAGLPRPEALITDVGSRIFFPASGSPGGGSGRERAGGEGSPVSGTEWEEDLRWWSRALATWRPVEAVRALEGVPGFSVDAVDGEDPRGPKGRISGRWDGDPGVVAQVEKALKEAGLPVRILTSRGRIDVIPASGGKGAAARYAVGRLGWRKVLACGDNGNDRDLLLAGFPAVLVGNADKGMREERWPPRVYIASKPYACGILQGWEHWYGGPNMEGP